MRRRDFIRLLGGATVAWPLAARGQSEGVRRVGVLLGFSENNPDGKARLLAFRQALEHLGWSEGRTLRLEYRSDERTLTDEEVEEHHAKLASSLLEKFSAEQR